MKKRIRYKLGDVFRLKLDKNNNYGFGRITKTEGCAFVDFYKIKPSPINYSLEILAKTEAILRIWCGDHALRSGEWEIIGNLPVEPDYKMPYFWNKSEFTDGYVLIEPEDTFEALFDRYTIVKSFKEIKNKNAQSYGLFGYDSAKWRYIKELKKCKLL